MLWCSCVFMKTIFYIIIAVGTVYLASIVTPDEIKSRVMAAVGLQDFSVTETISNTASDIKDKVVPKSPSEKRADMIERMEESLIEIREAQQRAQLYSDPDEYIETVSYTSQAIQETEELLEELKKENEKSKDGVVSSVVKSATGAVDAVVEMVTKEEGSPDEICLPPEEYTQKCTQ